MTRQQEWARKAHEKVLARGKGEKESAKKYATLCMRTPALIQQAGLAQALAFLLTRKEANIDNTPLGKFFVNDLAQVLKGVSGDDLQKEAHKSELPAYLALSRDVMAVAVWFRRFAQAELKTDGE
jgi:CRISPR-associated protein Cmr5